MEIIELPFGREGTDRLRLEFGALGSERYYVNGTLAYRRWGLMPRSLRQFEYQQHRFTVQLSTRLRAIKGTVHVDGRLISDGAFAAFNARLARRRQARVRRGAEGGFGASFSRLFVWLSCGMLAFALIQSCAG